jgi:hypothetical protein
VFLAEGKAVYCGTHWRGAADFLVEIISHGERTRDKIPFYSIRMTKIATLHSCTPHPEGGDN